NSTNDFSAAGSSNATASPTAANFSSQDASTSTHDSDMPNLEDLTHSDDADDVGAEADINNLESIISVSSIPTTRIHKDHPTSQIIGDLSSTTHTRIMARTVRDQGGISQMFNEDFHTCMFACFLSQEEPKRVHQALKDPSWIEAMQKSFFSSKCRKNKARLVAQGHTQEEVIDYEEVFAPIARIEAIRLFLAYASFMGFLVYQWMSKVHFSMALSKRKYTYVSHQSLRILKILTKYTKWSRHFMDYIKPLELGLQVKQKKDRIFINQDKYVAEILKKFGLSEGKSASTPIDAEKPL
nr:hypothetical protein [Tanacetum cinerariifolium]